MGKKSDFEYLELSLTFTEHDRKKRKYPVSGGSLCENIFLESKVKAEWLDSFMQTKSQK